MVTEEARTPLFARLRLRSAGLARVLVRIPVVGALSRKAAGHLVPRGSSVWAKIKQGAAAGLWIQVDARSEADFRQGDREPAVQEVLKRWLAPGKVFYDIGANVGFFSLLASRLVGSSGKIFAFEAEPDAAMRLRAAARRNNLSNLTIVEAAVWSETGTVSFDRGLGSPDRVVGHVVEHSHEAAAGCLTVASTSLDDFARTALAPDVVKCDVEGAEAEVFRGALGLLLRQRPKVVCEVHSETNLRALDALFAQAGYRVLTLEATESFPLHLAAEPGR